MINNVTFIINEKLLFAPKSGSLSLRDNLSIYTQLSKPASRLLKELIQLHHEKNFATRDELLINVWENHGLVSSNNNLNTYISEIRKKIDSISKNSEFIITIPKKGFRLNGKIELLDVVKNENEKCRKSDITSKNIYLPQDEIEKQTDTDNRKTILVDKSIDNKQILENTIDLQKPQSYWRKKNIYLSLTLLSVFLIYFLVIE